MFWKRGGWRSDREMRTRERERRRERRRHKGTFERKGEDTSLKISLPTLLELASVSGYHSTHPGFMTAIGSMGEGGGGARGEVMT